MTKGDLARWLRNYLISKYDLYHLMILEEDTWIRFLLLFIIKIIIVTIIITLEQLMLGSEHIKQDLMRMWNNWSNYHLLLRFRQTSGQRQNIIWCQNIFWCNWLKVMLDARVQLGETPVSGFS